MLVIRGPFRRPAIAYLPGLVYVATSMAKTYPAKPKSSSATAPKFSKDTLDFIRKAGRQKNPLWLDRNRDAYENHVQHPLQNLARVLKSELGSSAPHYHFPQKGIARLKRSAARAEDHGSHYRDWLTYSAAAPRTSRFDHNPNLFFLVYPDDPDGDSVLVAGGLYMPSSRQLRTLREAIAEDATPFDRLFASAPFAKAFPDGFSDERISSRPPRGFDPAHPRLDWLKLQAYFVWKPYRLRDFYSPSFAQKVAADFAQVVRLNDLLEKALQGRWIKHAPKETVARGLATRLEELQDLQAPRRKMDF